jgi:hypothetical protein
MIRALVERLPVLVCPRWVSVPAQPIAIDDVIRYLLAALDLPDGTAGIYEIGGPDVVSYGDLMLEYARQRGLRRWLVPVPVLTPTLSSLWLGLVTPLHARVGRQLIDGVRTPTVLRSDAARRSFPVVPATCRDAVAHALAPEETQPRASSPGFVEEHALAVRASPAEAFAPVRRIGGRTGWYYGDWLWSLRGMLDRLAGGAGLRRVRTDPEVLHAGDVVDCWRVEEVQSDRLLRLRAEMRLPGRAWLQFAVVPRPPGECALRLTAIFEPAGPAGRLYWYALYPVHALVFRGLLRGIVERIERERAPDGKHPGPRPAPRAANLETGVEIS